MAGEPGFQARLNWFSSYLFEIARNLALPRWSRHNLCITSVPRSGCDVKFRKDTFTVRTSHVSRLCFCFTCSHQQEAGQVDVSTAPEALTGRNNREEMLWGYQRALAASGCDTARVEHKPRLLSDNGPCCIASDRGEWLEKRSVEQVHGASCHPHPMQDRALVPDAQEPHPARELLLLKRPRGPDRRILRTLQSSPIPRKHPQPEPSRRLLRAGPNHPVGTRKDQTGRHQTAPIAPSAASRLNQQTDGPETPNFQAPICLKSFADRHARPVGFQSGSCRSSN